LRMSNDISDWIQDYYSASNSSAELEFSWSFAVPKRRIDIVKETGIIIGKYL